MGKATHIVVYVSGGVAQDVIADGDGVEVMVVDYDNEYGGEPKSSRAFAAPRIDPDYIDATVSGVED
jgi:hypothetical protein